MSSIPRETAEKIEEVAKYHDPKKKAERTSPDGEREKLEPVVTGKVIVRKKSLGTRAKSFFEGDVKSVGGYVFDQVVMPAIRDLLYEAINAAAGRAIYKDDVFARRSVVQAGKMKTPYNTISSRKAPAADPRPQMSRQARARHDFTEIVIPDRTEAETAILKLVELVERFDQATVADLYDIVHLDHDFVDTKWGWTNLELATVKRVSQGWLLILPETEQLD